MSAPEDPDGAPPVFFVPQTYRRRRLADAARVLPVVGMVIFALPALGFAPGNGAARLVLVFAGWLGLIAVAAILARPLRRTARPRVPAPEDDLAP